MKSSPSTASDAYTTVRVVARLMPSDVGKAIGFIRRAVKRGEITEKEIDESCRKILQAKY